MSGLLEDPVLTAIIIMAASGLGVAIGAAIARPRPPPPPHTKRPSGEHEAEAERGTQDRRVMVLGDLAATAYYALSDLTGCKGVLVVESGRILCVTSDEEAEVVWPRERGRD